MSFRSGRPAEARGVVLGLVLVLSACETSTGPTPMPSATPGGTLPSAPQAVTPAAGSEAASDTPTFTVQNAQGFDAGQAQYTFDLVTAGLQKPVLSITVPAGSGTTSFIPQVPLPRASQITWLVTARGTTGATAASARSTFRTRAVECVAGRDRYGKSVLDSFLTACSRARNRFNDPREVLGPPDSSGNAPNFTGFMSLGEKGYVTVDMETCATDSPGPDLRVWQRASDEPVTLYASGRPDGPFVLLEARLPCGNLVSGVRSGYCDFNLGDAEMQEARYFKIEDGEHYPCEQAGTDTEGADIDAIEILNRKQ